MITTRSAVRCVVVVAAVLVAAGACATNPNEASSDNSTRAPIQNTASTPAGAPGAPVSSATTATTAKFNGSPECTAYYQTQQLRLRLIRATDAEKPALLTSYQEAGAKAAAANPEMAEQINRRVALTVDANDGTPLTEEQISESDEIDVAIDAWWDEQCFE